MGVTTHRGLTASTVFGILAIAGCPAEPPEADDKLEIVVAGCASWAPDGACEHLPGTELRVWLPARGQIQVDADRTPLTITTTAADAGRRVQFELPKQTRRLRIRAGDGQALLAVAPIDTSTPSDPQRRAARALFDGGRSALRAGRLDLSVARLSRSASVARGLGDVAAARDADLLAAFVDLVLRGAIAPAAARMQALPRPPAIDGRGRILDHYHRGLVAARTADARRGLQELELAERWGRRLGSKHAASATHERARLLMDLGRAREAAAAFDALVAAPDPDSPCTQAAIAVSAGWARVVARPPFELDVARHRFESAESIYTRECPSPADANNVRVNLAFIEAREAPGKVRGHLARVVGTEQPESRAWRHALEGRIQLDAGDLRAAEQTYRRLLEDARRISLAPLEWQALVGLGRVARRANDLPAARRHLEAAEEVLAGHGELVPINRGRRFLLEDRSESLQLLVQTHLDAGRVSAGLASIRRARRRTVRAIAARDALALLSPEARMAWSSARVRYQRARAEVAELTEQAWTVSGADAARLAAARAEAEATARIALDALLHTVAPSRWFEGAEARGGLPRLSPDRLLIAPFRGADETHVFFARGPKVSVVRLADRPDAAGWARLLSSRLTGVASLRVLADPGAFAAALPEAPWRGAPLGAQLPIAHTLDLGPAPAPAEPPRGSLVVFDPVGDLADARLEGQEVAGVLARIAPPTKSLGPLEARPAAVRAALSGVRIFHFAGHGEYLGPQGWRSALRLVDGTLDMGDLLTLSTPPQWVVLTGCETARTRVGRVSAGLGLAQVLLAAGSEAVVATSAPVDSALALAFSRALYEGLERHGDLSAAFTGAISAMHAGERPWRDFLLLTRSP